MKATRIKTLSNGTLFVVFMAGWYDSIFTEIVVLYLPGDILFTRAVNRAGKFKTKAAEAAEVAFVRLYTSSRMSYLRRVTRIK